MEIRWPRRDWQCVDRLPVHLWQGLAWSWEISIWKGKNLSGQTKHFNWYRWSEKSGTRATVAVSYQWNGGSSEHNCGSVSRTDSGILESLYPKSLGFIEAFRRPYWRHHRTRNGDRKGTEYYFIRGFHHNLNHWLFVWVYFLWIWIVHEGVYFNL